MSKTRDTGFLGNVIKVDSNGDISLMHGSTMLMQISSSGAITTTGVISGSNALSASYAANTSYLNNSGSGEFVPTGSFNAFSSSILTYTGSVNSQLSSLQAQTGSYATTGSNIFVGSQTITGSILGSGSLSINGCIVSTGQIVAQTINVQQVTSSVVYSCGSNIFGCAITDTQQMTGSLRVTGSLSVVGTGCFSGQVCANSIGLPSGGTINNLANIQYGGYTWAGYSTSDGTITFSNASGCPIKFATGEACFASAINSPGGTISQDLRIYRSAGTTTGYINFGSTGTNYFGFDGSKYVANGALAATNGLFSGCIGIGATTVGAQLHIEKGGSDIDIKFTDIGVGSFIMGLRDGCARFEIANGNCLGTNTALSIDTSGRVGIGTTAGTYSLTTAGRGYFFATNQDAGYGMLTLDYGNGDNSNIYAIQLKEGNAVNAAIGYGSYGSSSCGDIVMWANNGSSLIERLRMFPDGASRFYVQESTSQTNGVGVVGRTCSKAVYLGVNCTYGYIQSHGSVPLYINELGNNVIMGLAGSVGIGSSSPYQKLVNAGHMALTTATAGTDATADVQRASIGWQAAASDQVLGSYITAANQGNWGSDIQLFTRSSSGGNAVERMRITSGGVTCFSSNVVICKTYNGNNLMLSVANSTMSVPFVTYDTAIIQADDVTTLKLVERNGGAADNQVLTFSTGDNTSRISTSGINPLQFFVGGSSSGCGYNGLGGVNALSIACSGISTFTCTVCFGQKTTTSNTSILVGNSAYQTNAFMFQQNLSGCQFTAGAGGDYIHIKTNVTKDDRMVGFNVRGYMYSPNPVDTDIAFYTYQPVSYVYGVTVYNKAYTGWSYCLYYSSDSKVVLVVQGSSTYGGFFLTGINTARYNNFSEMCILGITQTNTWSAQY